MRIQELEGKVILLDSEFSLLETVPSAYCLVPSDIYGRWKP